MFTRNNDMTSLLKRQEEDRKDLAAGAYEAWQAVRENEKRLLESYNGPHEHTSQGIKEALLKGREVFFKEWGSDGRLAAVMCERHERERSALVGKTDRRREILDQFRQSKERGTDKGYER